MAGDYGWKKSKPLMWALIVIIVLVWGWLLFGRKSIGKTKIPVSFVCSECNHITTFGSYPQGFVPFECEACGKKSAWDAYICNKCDPKGEHPFPHMIRLPKGVKAPEPGEEPSEKFMEALMRAEETPPVCPKCRRWRDVERYQTEEAKKIIEELRKKYQKNKS